MATECDLSFVVSYLGLSLGLSGNLVQILIDASASRFLWQRDYIFKTELLPLCERFPHRDEIGTIRVSVISPKGFKGIIANLNTTIRDGEPWDKALKAPCVESMAAGCLGFVVWHGPYENWDMEPGAKERWLINTKHALLLCALWNVLYAVLFHRTMEVLNRSKDGLCISGTDDKGIFRSFDYDINNGTIDYRRVDNAGAVTSSYSERLDILASGCAQVALTGEILDQEAWCKLVRQWIDLIAPSMAPVQFPRPNFYQE